MFDYLSILKRISQWYSFIYE